MRSRTRTGHFLFSSDTKPNIKSTPHPNDHSVPSGAKTPSSHTVATHLSASNTCHAHKKRLNRRRRSTSVHLSSPSMGVWCSTESRTLQNATHPELGIVITPTSPAGGGSSEQELKAGMFRAINHPAIHSIRVQQVGMSKA